MKMNKNENTSTNDTSTTLNFYLKVMQLKVKSRGVNSLRVEKEILLTKLQVRKLKDTEEAKEK